MKFISMISVAIVLLAVSLSTFAAPSISEKESSMEITKMLEKEVEQTGQSHRHHVNQGMQAVSRARVLMSKNTYMLLRSLKKVQGHDGRSPVCKICSTNFVDAITYDHFCLPDSEAMDGEICDTLTILGTTTPHHIGLACKLILSRRPLICK